MLEQIPLLQFCIRFVARISRQIQFLPCIRLPECSSTQCLHSTKPKTPRQVKLSTGFPYSLRKVSRNPRFQIKRRRMLLILAGQIWPIEFIPATPPRCCGSCCPFHQIDRDHIQIIQMPRARENRAIPNRNNVTHCDAPTRIQSTR